MDMPEFRTAVEQLAGRGDAGASLAALMTDEYRRIGHRCLAHAGTCEHPAFFARHGRNLLAMLTEQDERPPREIALLHAAAGRLQALRRLMRYEHRLRVPRRPYAEVRCGAYPFRDNVHDQVRVVHMADTSKPTASGRSYASRDVEPFVHPTLSQRRRAELYRSRLVVRRLKACDLQSPLESALIGQHGVFTTRAIAAGTCLGVYGGQLLSGSDWMLLPDDRYLITLNDDPPVRLDGESLLSLANTFYTLDAQGEVTGHPDGGYNCEMAGFEASFAHGWQADVPALFATRDLAPGEELRWNYGTVRVRAGAAA